MMRRILIPFDGSPPARRAVQYVAENVTGESVQVHVINVQEYVILCDVSLQVVREIEQAQREAGRKITLEAAEILQQAAIPHQLHVEMGLVADIIARQADALGCQLIVMGTRGHGAIAGFLLGSVATKVVHLAHVPVTLVK
jgi:nucleotide-binding universal stress UspA family protein